MAAKFTAERLSFRFEPVRTAVSNPEVVTFQLILAISAGAFRAGDNFPPARVLAQAMGVSQGTVSRAVKILEQHGVVTPLRGNQGGIRVERDTIPEDMLKLLSGRSDIWRENARNELIAARRAIEIPLAVLATENAVERDLDHMEGFLDEMAAAHQRNDLAGWIAADLRFHYSVGLIAQSSVLARYQHELLIELGLLVDRTFDFENSSHVMRLHQELLEAMRSVDTKRVRKLLEHLIELSD